MRTLRTYSWAFPPSGAVGADPNGAESQTAQDLCQPNTRRRPLLVRQELEPVAHDDGGACLSLPMPSESRLRWLVVAIERLD